jgi:hypothetical protein
MRWEASPMAATTSAPTTAATYAPTPHRRMAATQRAQGGPRSRPRYGSEDWTIQEHGHRPCGVRRLVQSPGVAGGARRAVDVADLRTARSSPVRWTDSHTLTRQQVAVRLLRKAGERPSPPNAGGRSGSPAHAEGRTPTRLALAPSTDDEHP